MIPRRCQVVDERRRPERVHSSSRCPASSRHVGTSGARVSSSAGSRLRFRVLSLTREGRLVPVESEPRFRWKN